MIITNRQELKRAIADAEQKKLQLEDDLSEQVSAIYESFKPGNILKNTFQNIVHTNGLGKSVLQATAGAGAGYLAAKILPGKTTAKLSTKILGSAIKLAVAGIGAAKIKKGAAGILRKLLPSNRGK